MIHPPKLPTLIQGLLLAAGFLALPSCQGGGDGDARTVAFVSNGVDPFWNVCAAGARTKAAELGIEVDVIFPDGSAADQKQKLEDLLVRGVDGVAVSPVDAEGLNGVLNRMAKEMPLITQDSDAPGSDRLCFIGVDNYAAGKRVGELVKEALPEGGQIVIFIGRLEQQNARARRQGVIDELLGRDDDRTRFDTIGEVPRGGKYEVLDTRVDNFDLAQAQSGAQDAIVAYPELDGMVGLFAYNAPTCLEAVKSADRLGDIKIVAFDEQDGTLDGIAAGHIHGTVSQNPFEYGAQSVRVLNALLDGDQSVLPEGAVIRVKAEVVRQDNLGAFREVLEARKQLGQ